VLGCAAVVLVCAPGAWAQSRLRFDGGGGGALPLAPSAITDLWSPGFVLTAGLRARVTPRLGIGPEVGYARFGFDADAFEATVADSFPGVNAGGNDLFVVSILVDAEFALTGWGNTRPYARAGIGWAHAGVTKASASGPGAGRLVLPDPGGDAATVRVGLGLRTLLTPTATLFVDACWQIAWLDPEPLQFVPIRAGLRF
jgi:hypothetical protein